MRHVFVLIFGLSFWLWSFSAKSQVFTPTIAGGIGGAGRAAIDGGESAFLNPASTAHLRNYYSGFHYRRGSHPAEGDDSTYAFQISDGTPTNIIPGGVAYTHRSIDLPNGLGSRTDTDYQLNVAGMALPAMALGVAGHYYTQSGQGRDDSQINGHVGLIFSPTDRLGIAAVGYDIMPIATTVLADRKLNPTYAVAVHYVLEEILRLRLDLVRPDLQPWNDRRTNVMTGIESFFQESFAFRFGAQWVETANQMNMTAGFGFHGPRLSVDYSFQKDIRSAGGVRHLIDLWLPL